MPLLVRPILRDDLADDRRRRMCAPALFKGDDFGQTDVTAAAPP
jgi:uncharacterized protein with PIN domain